MREDKKVKEFCFTCVVPSEQVQELVFFKVMVLCLTLSLCVNVPFSCYLTLQLPGPEES